MKIGRAWTVTKNKDGKFLVTCDSTKLKDSTGYLLFDPEVVKCSATENATTS